MLKLDLSEDKEDLIDSLEIFDEESFTILSDQKILKENVSEKSQESSISINQKINTKEENIAMETIIKDLNSFPETITSNNKINKYKNYEHEPPKTLILQNQHGINFDIDKMKIYESYFPKFNYDILINNIKKRKSKDGRRRTFRLKTKLKRKTKISQ